MNKTLLTSAMAGLALTLAVSAQANTITLDTPNSGLSVSSGPYGTVTIDLVDSTHATIEFKTDPGFVLVDGSAVAFNLNGTVVVSLSSVSPGTVSLSSQGSGTADGFGTFNTRFTSGNSSPSGRFTDVIFDLLNTSGTWSSDTDVLAANDIGNLVAAHIGVGGLTGDLSVTGFATGGGSGNNVPDGASTAILLGLALTGIEAARRRFARS
jgi:hypothetical protein